MTDAPDEPIVLSETPLVFNKDMEMTHEKDHSDNTFASSVLAPVASGNYVFDVDLAPGKAKSVPYSGDYVFDVDPAAGVRTSD